MNIEILQILAYLIVGAAVTLYVVLDGFDLGVGILQIFAGKDENRRIFLNSIGPFWDGNEVWLIAIVGTLFVAFPDVYSILLSGFYLLIMWMLLGVILRAVAMEFRSKEKSLKWRYSWDAIFWFASVTITFTAGVLLANLLIGVPITKERELYISLKEVFNPFAICVGVFAISLFALHGNIFLLIKTEGALQEKLHKFMIVTYPVFVLCFILSTIWTWTELPRITNIFLVHKVFFLLPFTLLITMFLVAYCAYKKNYGYSFLFSMIMITLFFLLTLVGTFPNMIPSTLDFAGNSLTIYNASSQKTTLVITLIIAATGLPLVFLYGAILYTVFKGKTKLTDYSY
jgi:cytochrome d ubiquinol oxidase subunit II